MGMMTLVALALPADCAVLSGLANFTVLELVVSVYIGRVVAKRSSYGTVYASYRPGQRRNPAHRAHLPGGEWRRIHVNCGCCSVGPSY